MTNKKNILIVGSGLAGSTLAHQLLRQGHHITIIDKGENVATSVAAGIVNPMVFRRMNKSWRLDEFLPEAKEFYLSLEQLFNVKLFHPITIRRLFSSEQEQASWLEKQQLPEFENYITTISEEDNLFSGATNQFGSGRVKNAFWVDSALFYNSNLAYFRDNRMLLTETFSLTEFIPGEANYKGKIYDKVVFCCGYLNRELPFFSNSPIEQTKGQTLTIYSHEIPENESLNRKCFVLPIGNQTFRIGSTYEWENATLTATEEGKAQLLSNLNVLGDFEVKIRTQIAGVRPTVLDRRPVLGPHPEFSKLYIFNGLGTKGYMMAPALAREMVDFMIEGKGVQREISVERFY